MGLNAPMNTAPPIARLPDQPAENFEQLLEAVGKTQDREAFITLFKHFAPRIKSFLMKNYMSPEAADELAQETMLAVWGKAGSYNPARAKASTWIYTIARNKRIDSLRKTGREPIVDYDPIWVEDDKPGPSARLLAKDEHGTIGEALKTLPKDQSELLYKSFFEGKAHGEIAEETGLPLGTVKSRIRAALKRLRSNEQLEALQ